MARKRTTAEESAILRDLELANEALGREEWYPANTFKLEEDFQSLNLWDQIERNEALARAASEVTVEDYAPLPPPGISDEPACRGVVMRAFIWMSDSFKHEMYFKFGIQRHGYLYVFSLHKPHFVKRRQSHL